MSIAFNQPTQVGTEAEMILAAYHNQEIAGDGPFGRKVEKLLKEQLASNRVLLTTSCTHALEMAGILLDFTSGDEVIVPSFTFVTTALAFFMQGARPVFADIREDTLNIDETKLESLITDKTRAVVVVHYAGVACELNAIQAICDQHGLILIEDNAHGLYGRYHGRLLGTFGKLSAQSFHETKNFTCGEGGALVINDCDFVERAEIIREKGTDRSKFFRGQVDKYSWVDKGSSYVLSDIQAAMLHAQLLVAETVQQKRQKVWNSYKQGLSDWAQTNGVQLPHVPDHCDQAYHMFYLLLPDQGSRDEFLRYLNQYGITAVFHYLPLHQSKMGIELGGLETPCPVSTDISARLVRLPFYTNISAEDQDQVIEAVCSFSPSVN